MAKIIKADGTVIGVKPLDGQDELSLQQLQDAVEGHIEMVPIFNPAYEDKIMFCNEEGKLHNLPINLMATAIACIEGDVIVGNVILCDQGETS